jgi:hypothetical protein
VTYYKQHVQYIPFDQGLPMVNSGNSALLTGDISYIALNMQTLPCLLCSPLEPSYDVNIHQPPPRKSVILGQMGYIINMAYLHIIKFKTYLSKLEKIVWLKVSFMHTSIKIFRIFCY